MPTFTFKSPEGKTYTINGPEGATKEQAWDMLQTQLDGGAQAPAAAATPSKSFGEKLANFARNVYNNPPPSVEALMSAVTLPGRAAQGQADFTTDEGIAQNMPEALGLATLSKLGLSRTAGGAGSIVSPRAEKLVQDAQATAKATGTQPAFDASRFLDHPAVDAGMDFLLPAWAGKAIRMGRRMLPETPEAPAPGPGPTGPSVPPSTPFQPGAQQQASGVAGAPRLTFPDSPFGEPPAAPSVPNVPPPPWGFPTEPRAPVKVNTGDIEKTLLAQVRALNRADKQAAKAPPPPPAPMELPEVQVSAPTPAAAPPPNVTNGPIPMPAPRSPITAPAPAPPPGVGLPPVPQAPAPTPAPPPVLAAKAITKANGKVTTTPSERSPEAPVEPVAPVTPPTAAVPSAQADGVLARMKIADMDNAQTRAANAAPADDLMTQAKNTTHAVSYEDQLGETRRMDLREHSAALDPNVGMDPLAAANHIADNLEKGGYKYHTSRENFVEDYLAPVLESKAQAADRLSRILPGNIPADKLTHHMWALNKEQARTWRTQLMEEYAPHLASQIKAAFPDKLLTNWSSSRRR